MTLLGIQYWIKRGATSCKDIAKMQREHRKGFVMGSGHRKGESLAVVRVIQVGKMTRVFYDNDTSRFVHIDKLAQKYKSMIE